LALNNQSKVSREKICLIALVSFVLFFSSGLTQVASSSFAVSGTTPAVVSTPVNLSGDSPTQATYPAVASSGSYVYVAWSEGSGGIKFRSSSNYGANWSPPLKSPAMNLSSEGGLYGPVQFPVMTANGSDVFVAWSQDWSSLGLEIFEASSVNNGTTFTVSQLTFSNGEGNTTEGGYIIPAIAASGPNVYVSFSGNGSKSTLSADGPNVGSGFSANSYVMSSNDYGMTWSAPHLYTHSVEDELAAWGNDAYAIADHTLAVSQNAGKTWKVVRANSTFLGDEPMIAAYGQYVYVVTELPYGPNRNETYIRAYISDDSGTKFTVIKDLSPTLNDSWAPMVGTYGDGHGVGGGVPFGQNGNNGSSAWVALRQYPGGAKGQVWVYTTTDGGESWSGPVSLSGTGTKGTAETFPFDVVSTDGQHVFVGWSHQVRSGYWTFTVGYSSDGGTTWTPPGGVDVSLNSKGEAGFEHDLAVAAISASGAYCYAVWQYMQGATDQVYFNAISV
jgi:hypothetical protein